VFLNRGEVLPIKTRIGDKLEKVLNTFAAVYCDALRANVVYMTSRVQNYAKMQECMLKSDII